MGIVVDTSVIIDFLRREGSTDSLYTTLQSEDNLTLSMITVGELYAGDSSQSPAGKRFVTKFLQRFKIVAPNFLQAKLAGNIRQKYKLTLDDAFIAALAIDKKCKLATLDLNHFKKIKDLKLYK